MVSDPTIGEHAVVVDFAEIEITFSDLSWYLGTVDSSLYAEISAIATALSEYSKEKYFKNYGVESTPPLLRSSVLLADLHLVIGGICFEPGSRKLRLKLDIAAKIFSIVAATVTLGAGVTKALADYPAAKSNFAEFQTDVNGLASGLAAKIREVLVKNEDVSDEREGYVVPEMIVEVNFKRGSRNVAKLLLDAASRNQQ